MRSSLTPGAQRALDAASNWISCNDSADLNLPEILLGLLAEPECRAALILTRHQVDERAVRERFPSLRPNPFDQPRESARAWINCLRTVEDLLVDYPRPLELATEHLLLGLVASDNEVSRWLAERGLEAEALEAEIHRLAGHLPGPLSLDSLIDEPGDTAGAELLEAEESLPVPDRAEPAAGALSKQIATLRILDAAANRAGEGLRVIEDYLRFDLDDAHLTCVCKAIRHELTAALSVYSRSARHVARETRTDVGTGVSHPAEQTRTDLTAVLAANFGRVEQSLRSLEEFSKTISPQTAGEIEQLRYRVYTLERSVEITRSSLQRLANARLYVLIDGGKSLESFERTAERLVDSGVHVVQLRDKTLDDRRLLERARRLREITAGSETLFIMNDRPDLAVLSGADGVHVGQEELSVKDARRILGPDGLIGVSTHSIEQARAAVLDGADYIGVGPTFPSGTKQFREFTGTSLLRAVAAEIRLPAFAIGGITLENLEQVLATGITRVAVSGAISTASDPALAAREFLEYLVPPLDEESLA